MIQYFLVDYLPWGNCSVPLITHTRLNSRTGIIPYMVTYIRKSFACFRDFFLLNPGCDNHRNNLKIVWTIFLYDSISCFYNKVSWWESNLSYWEHDYKHHAQGSCSCTIIGSSLIVGLWLSRYFVGISTRKPEHSFSITVNNNTTVATHNVLNNSRFWEWFVTPRLGVVHDMFARPVTWWLMYYVKYLLLSNSGSLYMEVSRCLVPAA